MPMLTLGRPMPMLTEASADITVQTSIHMTIST
jgi:hypothetical protein